MATAGSPRSATVGSWWRRWPSWSPYAAMAWSASYGTLALGWALGAPGFPFGEHDPEGAAMGSVLFATRPEPTGLVMAGCCAVGVFVARAMRRPAGHRTRRRVLLAVAWSFASTLVLYRRLGARARADRAAQLHGLGNLGAGLALAVVGSRPRHRHGRLLHAPARAVELALNLVLTGLVLVALAPQVAGTAPGR